MSAEIQARPGVGIGLAALASVGAAAYVVIYRIGVKAGSAQSAVLVMLIAAAVWSTLAAFLHERSLLALAQSRRSWLLAAGLATLTLSGNLLASEALDRISAPVTSVFQQTQVLFVPLLAFAFLGERLSAAFWFGLGLALAGLLVMRLGPAASVELTAEGAALASGSALSFAVMMVVTKRIVHEIQPVSFNAARLWLSVLLWFVWQREWPAVDELSATVVVCSTVAALIGPVLARLCLMYSLKHIPAGLTTLMGLLSPVLSIAPSYWVFGESPSNFEFAGGALMTLGIALPVWRKLRRT